MIKTRVSKFGAFFLGALFIGTSVNAEPVLSMKTSIEDVNGVRDVEAGNYQTGIRKLEAALAKTSVTGNRLPILTNLCVAHVATGDLEQANRYCNDAVQHSNKLTSTIALNNRAVLHYLNDDLVAAAADLEAADKNARMPALIKGNLEKLQRVTTLAKN
ncbi:hypothetical protein [Alteromonas halophila]|uniref:Tetratricopeptide repeat protein n=1 Tax=Alteromonas halophila TaxID=516698 RepID=A0A918JPN5_9ALTE|nr:hypothetical protein [Alteromonas halophila]GGW93560.1 hypothetical protein GCM10007391_29930 [Alteromonas halophila]